MGAAALQGPVLSGPSHPRWKGGKCITRKGYVQITAGPNRNKYEHRVVIEELMGCEIPVGMEIHHIDRNRQHNCPGNLMLLQDVIHHAIDAGQRPRLAWYEKHRKKQGLMELPYVVGASDPQETPF